MKKTTQPAKLRLKKQVVATLDAKQMNQAIGGAEPSLRCTKICLTGNYTYYCPTINNC